MMDKWDRTHRPWDAEAANDDIHRGANERAQEAVRHKTLEAELDRALEDGFPGSDPVSVVQPASARKRQR